MLFITSSTGGDVTVGVDGSAPLRRDSFILAIDGLRPSRLDRPDTFRGGGGGGGGPDVDDALEGRCDLCTELLEPLRDCRGEGDGSLEIPAIDGDGLLATVVRRAGGGGGALEVAGGANTGDIERSSCAVVSSI